MKSPKVKRPVKYLEEWNRRFEQYCRDNPHTDVHDFDRALEWGDITMVEYWRIRGEIDLKGHYIMTYKGGA